MEPPTLIGATEREGGLVLSAGKAGTDAPVAACPGWVVGDVLGHLGRVYCSASEIIERRSQEVPAVAIPKPPDGDAVLAFFAENLERIVAALDDIAPDEPVYTWSDQKDGAFYHRRMAHETAVHRYDVQAAHGEPDPFDPELAADAVDELYHILLPFSIARWERPLPGGTMHLHRTDGPGEWLLRVADGALVVTREHAKGDVAVRGPASDLLRFAWNRGRSGELEVFGDAALADEWAALAP